MDFKIIKLLFLTCLTHLISGPNCPRIRGTTTRDTKVLRVKEQMVAIPREFHKIHKMVTITADVMFINEISFLVMFLGKITFRTAGYILKRTTNSLAKHLQKC